MQNVEWYESFRYLVENMEQSIESVRADTKMNPESGGRRIEHLEGLRGIAACMVLFGHIKATFWPDVEATLAAISIGVAERSSLLEFLFFIVQSFIQAASNGVCAVWIFWVMSAYVLTYKFHSESDKEKSNRILAVSSLKRYPRLAIPVSASVLFAWALHTNGWMSNGDLAATLGQKYYGWLGSFYLFDPDILKAIRSAIWETFFAYDKDTSYNCVLWTISGELYGSLFLFGYLALVGKHWLRIPLYAISAGLCWTLQIYWLDAFLFGCLLCDLSVNRKTILSYIPASIRLAFLSVHLHTGPTLLLLAAIVVEIGVVREGDRSVLVSASVLSAFVVLSSLARHLLSRPLPVFLGRISFGLYLTHLPIICALAFPFYILASQHLSAGFAAVVSAVGLLIFTALGGWVFWYFIDRPTIAITDTIMQILYAVRIGQPTGALVARFSRRDGQL